MDAKILVSACLLGEPVRYDGSGNEIDSAILADWRRQGCVVAFCPEVAGELGTPRPPAEIVGGTGGDVLAGTARVETKEGEDVTGAFLSGARAALEAAREADADAALLKSGSPSCGSRAIYDGTFSSSKRPGRGVTAALLERHGIRVFREDEIEQASRYLEAISPEG